MTAAGTVSAVSVNVATGGMSPWLPAVQSRPLWWVAGSAMAVAGSTLLFGWTRRPADRESNAREVPEASRTQRRNRRWFLRGLARAVNPEVPVQGWQRRYAPLAVECDGSQRPCDLARALRKHRQGVVYLEGEPGAGKTIALRHVTRRLAERAQQGWRSRGRVALYVPLGDFRLDGDSDDATLDRYVKKVINPARDAGVNSYLTQEFEPRLENGEWLLFFDAFDEIPEVLAAQDGDDTVARYAKALFDYVEQRRCAAVIASRAFHGLSAFNPRRWRVVKLSRRQQRDLVRRNDDLERQQQELVLIELDHAGSLLGPFADNPFLLDLACRHMAATGRFPTSVHAAFDEYVHTCLRSDGDLLAWARAIAYCMVAVDGLGLSPSRRHLRAALTSHGTPVPSDRLLDDVLDELEKRGLAERANAPEDPLFVFRHRRIQEYFAAGAMLDDPGLVSREALVTESRWREVAVSLLQTQTSSDRSADLLTEIESRLTGLRPATSPGLPLWPGGVLPVLHVLGAGLGNAPERIPPTLRAAVGEVLTHAWRDGLRHDHLRVLQLLPIAPAPVVLEILTSAVESPSPLLRDEAFRQLAQLATLSDRVCSALRHQLFVAWATAGPFGARRRIEPYLRRWTRAPHEDGQLPSDRTDDPAELAATYRLLRCVMGVDLVLLTASGLPSVAFQAVPVAVVVSLLVVMHLALWRRRSGLGHTAMPALLHPPLVHWTLPHQPGGVLDRILSRLIRLSMAGLLVLWILGGPLPPALAALSCGGLLYAVAWADSAMDLVLTGPPAPVRAWALIPLRWWRRDWGLLFDGRLVRILEKALEVLAMIVLTVIIGAVFLGLITVGVRLLQAAGVIAPAAPPADTTTAGSTTQLPVALVGTAIPTGFALIILALPLMAALEERRSRRVYRKQLDAVTANLTEPTSPDDVTSILETVTDWRHNHLAAAALRQRTGPYLIEALDLLTDILQAVEEGGHTRYEPQTGSPYEGADPIPERLGSVAIPHGSRPAFRKWAANSTYAPNVLIDLTEEALDEIGQLLVEHETAQSGPFATEPR